MTSWRTHLKFIIPLLILAVIGGIWYIRKPDVARMDIEKMMGREPDIQPMRTEYTPTVKIPDIVGWQGDAKPVAAPGLKVTPFAAKLDHPRWMLVLANGDVLVAETTQPARETKGVRDWITRKIIKNANGSDISADRITLLRDADHDGRAEFQSVLLSAANGLHSPFGMAVIGDKLYVANTDAVLSFPFKPGETSIAAKGTKIVDLPATHPNNHWTRNLLPTPDGKGLFITVGSNSNIGENGMESEKNRANILQLDLATGKFFRYATGLRNPTGMGYDPVKGRLWTVVNERDMLGSDGPPDYLAWVDIGMIYGWPSFYFGGFPDPRVADPDMANQRNIHRPEYALGSHVAALGLTFTDARTRLGAPFARGAIVGLHGSWNRSPLSGYKVIYVPFNEKGFAEGKAVDVLTGFLNAKQEAQGRPVGVVIDSTGALLVADDAGNRIWRVSRAQAASPSVKSTLTPS